MDLKNQGYKLQNSLNLQMPAVAISFRSSPPAGIQHVESSGPSSCSYWKLAAEGKTFYTNSPDHLNCTIGAYTHGVEMPPEKGKELESMLGEMVKLNYIRMEEVPGIPRRTDAFGVAIYSPLSDAPFEPDVVLVRGNARQIMLLAEAAKAANIEHDTMTMGRPTCAMIPAAIQSERGVSSFGCVGNRVYTGIPDDELYLTIPGSKVAEVIDKLEVICNANRELETFHKDHAAAVASGR